MFSTLTEGALPLYHFESVKDGSPYFSLVAQEFHSVIAPIYGDQKIALDKIAAGTDRVCEVLLNNISNEIAGILVYKLDPTDEFSSYNIYGGLEIKTLFVVNAATQSGRGIGSQLINRVIQVAQDVKFNSIVVTVSSEKLESQEFFLKKKFTHITSFVDKYKRGSVECLYALQKTDIPR